jgi:uncharacterized RDD family membrane protein YckC
MRRDCVRSEEGIAMTAATQNDPIAGNSGRAKVIDVTSLAAPIRYVNWGNYFLVVGGVWGLAAMLDLEATQAPSASGLLFTQAAIGVCGFCLWVGWHNIGTLNALVNPQTTRALALFAGFMLLCAGVSAAGLAGANTARNDSVSTFTSIGSAAVEAAAAVIALDAVWRARRGSLPELRGNMYEFLSRLLVEREPPRGLHAKAPRTGVAFLVLGIIWFLLVDLIPDRLIYHDSSTARAFGQIQAFGFIWLIYARSHFEPEFRDLLSADRRPPILLLRSFVDDEKWGYQDASKAFFDFSLESRLSTYFASMGPFIAVGAPKDRLPHLGAIRTLLSDAEWQTSVTGWMKDSQLIVLLAGTTHWIDWELGKIIELGHTGKLIVLFPSWGGRFRWWRRRTIATPEERLAMVRRAFQSTVWSSALASPIDAKRVRTISFEPDGGVVVVTSKSGTRDSLQIATLLADSLIAGRRGAAPPVSDSEPRVGIEGASRLWRRGAAALVDVAVPWAAVSAIAAGRHPPTLVVSAAVILVTLFCYVISEAVTGATVGKVLFGVAVRSKDGHGPCSLRQAAIRNVLRIVDGVGCYLVGFLIAESSPLRQRLGDRLAKTAVVREPRPTLLRVAAVVVVAVAAGACLVFGRADIESAIHPFGPRLTFEEGELYYVEPVKKEEAQGVGYYLAHAGYFTKDHRSTVQLDRQQGIYRLRFVVDLARVDDSFALVFAKIGSDVSRIALGDAPLEVELCDESLHPTRVLPETGRLAFGKGEIYYDADLIAKAEAQRVGDYLVSDGYFPEDSGKTVYFDRRQDTYRLRLVVNPAVLTDSIALMFAKIGSDASRAALGGAPLEVTLCDNSFTSVKVLPQTATLVFAGGRLYYAKPIAKEEAQRVGDYLVADQYLSGDGDLTVHLGRPHGTYELRFVVSPARVTESIALLFAKIGSDASRVALGGAVLEVTLCDDSFGPVKVLPQTRMLAFGRGSLYYGAPVTEAMARRTGAILRDFKVFNDEHEGAFFLGRDDDGFELRFVVNPSVISDPAVLAELRGLSGRIDKEALSGERVVMHLCDGELHSLKREAFDPDAGATWTKLRAQ